MANKKVENMTVEELDEQLLEMSLKKGELLEDMREMRRLRDEKFHLEEAERKLATMSDPEKAALVQAIHSNGIESHEKSGTPG